MELFSQVQDALLSLPAFWLVVGTQVVGLCSAYLVRASEGSRHHLAFQSLFLVALAAIALTTLLSLCTHSAAWYPFGATLSVMVVGVTYHPQHWKEPAF